MALLLSLSCSKTVCTTCAVDYSYTNGASQLQQGRATQSNEICSDEAGVQKIEDDHELQRQELEDDLRADTTNTNVEVTKTCVRD